VTIPSRHGRQPYTCVIAPWDQDAECGLNGIRDNNPADYRGGLSKYPTPVNQSNSDSNDLRVGCGLGCVRPIRWIMRRIPQSTGGIAIIDIDYQRERWM